MKQKAQKEMESIKNEDLCKWHFTMKMFQSTRKKEKESIKINEKFLDDELILRLNEEHQNFNTVKKINFCESGIQELSGVFQLFPNL